MASEVEVLRDSLQEHKEFIAKLAEATKGFGTIIAVQNNQVVIASADKGMMLANAPEFPVKVGDQVSIILETGQIWAEAQRPPVGVMVPFERMDGAYAEIGSGEGAKRVAVAAGVDTKALRKGDSLLLDATGSCALLAIPAASHFKAEAARVRWEDVGGNAEAKVALKEAIALLRGGSRIFEEYRAKAPAGFLFYGPPGCGKTLLGKAVATELASDGEGGFIYIKGPEILSQYVGIAEARIRQLFAAARSYKDRTGRPAVIFIDEAEAILSKRGSGISSDMEKTIVPSFLTEMDGLESTAALVILATNRADMLDPAVVRDGRIDRKIEIGRPARDHAAEIFGINLAGLPIHEGQSVEELIGHACDLVYRPGGPLLNAVSGAMIAGTVNRAKETAMRRDTEAGKVGGLMATDLAQAIQLVEMEN